MAIIFDRVNRIIEVEAPATEVTIQQLIDAVCDFEGDQENMDMAQVAKASGKESLGGGLSVGITLELLNNWQLKFEDRLGPDYVQCTAKDGNLVGGIAGNPIKESAYTQVKLILSAAGTVAELELGGVAQEASLQNVINVLGVPTSPTLSDDVDQIEERTNRLPDDPADQSLIEEHITAELEELKKKIDESGAKKVKAVFKI